jgi:hypothetical protein
MSFDDLPKLRPRKWHRMSSSRRSLDMAKREARWFKSRPETTAVKIVKETRWRVFWKQR